MGCTFSDFHADIPKAPTSFRKGKHRARNSVPLQNHMEYGFHNVSLSPMGKMKKKGGDGRRMTTIVARDQIFKNEQGGRQTWLDWNPTANPLVPQHQPEVSNTHHPNRDLIRSYSNTFQYQASNSYVPSKFEVRPIHHQSEIRSPNVDTRYDRAKRQDSHSTISEKNQPSSDQLEQQGSYHIQLSKERLPPISKNKLIFVHRWIDNLLLEMACTPPQDPQLLCSQKDTSQSTFLGSMSPINTPSTLPHTMTHLDLSPTNVGVKCVFLNLHEKCTV